MSAYGPGTVATLSIGGEDVRAIVRDDQWVIVGHSYFKGIAVGNETLIDDVRPLVVLDWHPSPTHVQDLLVLLRENHWTSLAEQIEAQTKPPRIPEPGLWGVVEASYVNGRRRRWLHTDLGWWVSDIDTRADWDKLVDPVLLRDGFS